MYTNTNTDRARQIAAGYTSPAAADEMARFATSGEADLDALLECVERRARLLLSTPGWPDYDREVIRTGLNYLRTWIREQRERS